MISIIRLDVGHTDSTVLIGGVLYQSHDPIPNSFYLDASVGC